MIIFRYFIRLYLNHKKCQNRQYIFKHRITGKGNLECFKLCGSSLFLNHCNVDLKFIERSRAHIEKEGEMTERAECYVM